MSSPREVDESLAEAWKSFRKLVTEQPDIHALNAAVDAYKSLRAKKQRMTEEEPLAIVQPLTRVEAAKAYFAAPSNLVVHFDGASKGNPGKSGSGWIISDKKTGNTIAYGWEGFEHATNNQAEYSSLILALEYLQTLSHFHSVEIYGDSKQVIETAKGNFNGKAPLLVGRIAAMRKLISSMWKPNKFEFKWIEREENTIADHLSNVGVKHPARTVHVMDTENPFVVDIPYLRMKHG